MHPDTDKITVACDPDYAPCGYLICRVREDGTWDTRDEENTVLFQIDYDYPSLARTMGWDMREVQSEYDEALVDGENNPETCNHSGTDGTVDCPCGVTAAQFIEAAADYLDAHEGELVEDPGYFS